MAELCPWEGLLCLWRGEAGLIQDILAVVALCSKSKVTELLTKSWLCLTCSTAFPGIQVLFSLVPLGGGAGSRTDTIPRVSNQENQKIPSTSHKGNVSLLSAQRNEKQVGEGDPIPEGLHSKPSPCSWRGQGAHKPQDMGRGITGNEALQIFFPGKNLGRKVGRQHWRGMKEVGEPGRVLAARSGEQTLPLKG